MSSGCVSCVSTFGNTLCLVEKFSDGNGRIGRLIVLAQCLQIGIKPPTVNNSNKALYYILLEHAKINPTPLAYF
jgi:Fic family protein